MDKQRLLAELNALAEKEVNSWQDLYNAFHHKLQTFKNNPCKATVDDALFTLYSFVLALEGKPEEGDALAIAREMNRIVLFEGEKLGATLDVIDRQEVVDAVNVLSKYMLSKPMQQAEETPTKEDNNGKPYLH